MVQALDSPFLRMHWVALITPVAAGAPVLRFSDWNFTYGGIRYEEYIESIEGLSDEISRSDSSFLNSDITIRFLNDTYTTYNHLSDYCVYTPYSWCGADVQIYKFYFTRTGIYSSSSLIFRGVLDSMKNCDIRTFEYLVSSRPKALAKRWEQQVIDTTTWPRSYEDTGNYEPIIYGYNMCVPAERVSWGIKTTLAYNISATTTNAVIRTLKDGTKARVGIMLSDKTRFTELNITKGVIVIDDEEIYWNGIDAYGNLKGVMRARSGTKATTHQTGAEIWEKRMVGAVEQYDSLLANHELQGVGNKYAEIEGKLVKVLSGLTVVVSGGKTLLRAGSQVSIASNLINTLNVNQGNHTHTATGGDSKREYGDSATWDAGTGTEFKGSVSSVYDQNFATSCYFQSEGGYDYPSGSINVSFKSNSAKGYTVCVKYSSSSASASMSALLGNNTVVTYELGSSATAVTKKFACPSCPKTIGVDYNCKDDMFAGTLEVYEVWYEYTSIGISSSPATGVALKGEVTLVDTRKVDRFHAFVSGYKSPSSGYGTVDSLMQRPDYIIKHFLLHILDFGTDEYDAASFTAAGAKYALSVNGFSFGMRIAEKVDDPIAFVQSMAAECFSTLRYIAGKWYLDFLPDEAPYANKTVYATELAEENGQWKFWETGLDDLCNSIAVKYSRIYSNVGTDSEWKGTIRKQHTPSISKYGKVHKEIELKFVRSGSMASRLGTLELVKKYRPLIGINGRLFWEHSDIVVGQTIRIDNPIFDSFKFYIEKVSSPEKGIIEVEGIEWWGSRAYVNGDTRVHIKSTANIRDTIVVVVVIPTPPPTPPIIIGGEGWGKIWGVMWGSDSLSVPEEEPSEF